MRASLSRAMVADDLNHIEGPKLTHSACRKRQLEDQERAAEFAFQRLCRTFQAKLRGATASTNQEWPHVLARPARGVASDIQLRRAWQLQRHTRDEPSDSISTPRSMRDDGE